MRGTDRLDSFLCHDEGGVLELMKALEFESVVTPGGQIVWEATDSELAWRRTGRQQFEAAYAPEDAVYEQLILKAAVSCLA